MDRYLYSRLYLFIPLLILIAISDFGQAYAQPSTPEADTGEPIKIGLLISADTAGNPAARQAVDAVDLVLDRVNESGGVRGRTVKAIVKSVAGNWGVGSTQSVDLIYEDEVIALLGFVDGRSAHLIEQVSAKAQIPFISTLSPDPTLSRINIPWFFSSMPRADQQAGALVKTIYNDHEKETITLISSDDYDCRSLTRSFLRETENKGYPAPSVVTYQSGTENFQQVIDGLSGSNPDGIVFFGSTEEGAFLYKLLVAGNLQLPVYFPVMDLGRPAFSDPSIPLYAIEPEHWNTEPGVGFRIAFYNNYGYRPTISVSYIRDAAVALIEAIRLKGSGHDEVRTGLLEVEFEGISGRVSFDASGLTKGKLNIVNTRNLHGPIEP